MDVQSIILFLPGPVAITMEFFSSSTQSIQTAKPWHTPSQANSIYKIIVWIIKELKTEKRVRNPYAHFNKTQKVTKLHPRESAKNSTVP